MQLLVLLIVVALVGLDSAWRMPTRSLHARKSVLHMSTYQLNAKDLLLADSCSGLSRTEINEYVLKVRCCFTIALFSLNIPS